MSDPNPPENIPEYLETGLQSQEPETLREIAAYAMSLAESKEAQQNDEEEEEDPPEDGDPSEIPDDDDVPAKASTVIKEINDNRYYYWQWREGDSVKSKYKGPVNADE